MEDGREKAAKHSSVARALAKFHAEQHRLEAADALAKAFRECVMH